VATRLAFGHAPSMPQNENRATGGVCVVCADAWHVALMPGAGRLVRRRISLRKSIDPPLYQHRHVAAWQRVSRQLTGLLNLVAETRRLPYLVAAIRG
jgi:hypothetical protein